MQNNELTSNEQSGMDKWIFDFTVLLHCPLNRNIAAISRSIITKFYPQAHFLSLVFKNRTSPESSYYVFSSKFVSKTLKSIIKRMTCALAHI